MRASAAIAKGGKGGCGPRAGLATRAPVLSESYPDVQVSTLGLYGDAEVRRLLRRALRDAWPAVRRFGWQAGAVCELDPENRDVGYTSEDGTIFVKVRDPGKGNGRFYNYSFVLATLLHELTHLSVLGHGKAFYLQLVEAIGQCGAEPATRREVRMHVCAELLNAVCENDARRARAVLAVLPEAVACKMPGAGQQLPLEYAAHHGRVALTKLLIEARAEVDATCNSSGMPPLMRAAARGNKRTARVLLEAGAMSGQAADALALLEQGDRESSVSCTASFAGAGCSSSSCCRGATVGGGQSEQPCAVKQSLPEGAPRRTSSLPALPMVLPVSSSRLQQLLEARSGKSRGVRVAHSAGAVAGRLSMLSGSLAL